MGILLALLLVVLSVVCTYLIAVWILGPLDQAGKANRGKTQYRIIDFFCLIVELQIAIAVVSLFSPPDRPSLRAIAASVCAVPIIALWLTGVRTLSSAGILDPRRRTVFNWVVLPMASVGALALVPVWGGLVTVWLSDTYSTEPIGLWIAAILLPLGVLVSKPLSDWIVAGAGSAAPQSPPPK